LWHMNKSDGDRWKIDVFFLLLLFLFFSYLKNSQLSNIFITFKLHGHRSKNYINISVGVIMYALCLYISKNIRCSNIKWTFKESHIISSSTICCFMSSTAFHRLFLQVINHSGKRFVCYSQTCLKAHLFITNHCL